MFMASNGLGSTTTIGTSGMSQQAKSNKKEANDIAPQKTMPIVL
jgi:hypothetical protein